MGQDTKFDAFLKGVEKNYGKGALFTPKFRPLDIGWHPSGISSIDSAFGLGVPRGRILEIFGPESGQDHTVT
jgi:recombination protein RecA